MFRKVFFGLFLLMFLSLCLVFSGFDRAGVGASLNGPIRNLSTGLEYTTIQQAIDARETLDGHTIFVGEGTYYENVTVNKSLSLVGENESTTIIDGNYTENPVLITASHVNMTGFTFQKATILDSYMEAHGLQSYAIRVGAGAAYNNIRHNIITDNPRFGIIVNESTHNMISDDLFVENSWSDLTLHSSSSNIVFNNTFRNMNLTPHGEGIGVVNSTDNEFYDNHILNKALGIVLDSSDRNRFYANNMTDNLSGFYMFGSSASDYNNSIDMTNLVDSKHIYCLQGARGVVLDSQLDATTVYLIDCDNVTVKDLVLGGNGVGLLLWGTNATRIENMTATSNLRAISIENCANVTVRRCNIGNNRDGVFLNSTLECEISQNNIETNGVYGLTLMNSSHITIDDNNITGNHLDGIMIDHGYSNSITDNLIEGNGAGVGLQVAFGNMFYHNSFIHNDPFGQVEGDEGSYCSWDNGFEGNFWSDYTGIDANRDGIGDTPYTIHCGWDNVDHYPLLTPYSYWGNPIEGDFNRDMKVNMIDVASAASRVGSRPGDPKWNPHVDLNGDGVIDITDALKIANLFGNHYP